MGEALDFFLKEARRLSLNQCFKPFLPTQWLASFYQSPYAMKWRAFLLSFGGKRIMGNVVCIGVNEGNYAS